MKKLIIITCICLFSFSAFGQERFTQEQIDTLITLANDIKSCTIVENYVVEGEESYVVKGLVSFYFGDEHPNNKFYDRSCVESLVKSISETVGLFFPIDFAKDILSDLNSLGDCLKVSMDILIQVPKRLPDKKIRAYETESTNFIIDHIIRDFEQLS